MPDGYGGTALIPMPGRVDPLTIDSGSALRCNNFSKSKKAKRGMHGNQVSTAKLQTSCNMHVSYITQDPKKAREAQNQKWSSEGRTQVVLALYYKNCTDWHVFNKLSQADSLVELLNHLHTLGTITLTFEPSIYPHGISRIDVVDPEAFRRYTPPSQLQPAHDPTPSGPFLAVL